MSETLKPVPATDMLANIAVILESALRYGLVINQPLDHIDLEKIQTAAAMARTLLEAQK